MEQSKMAQFHIADRKNNNKDRQFKYLYHNENRNMTSDEREVVVLPVGLIGMGGGGELL